MPPAIWNFFRLAEHMDLAYRFHKCSESLEMKDEADGKIRSPVKGVNEFLLSGRFIVTCSSTTAFFRIQKNHLRSLA